MLVGGKLLCQHRALLRKECRNVHFALVATCAPALQLPALKCEGSEAANWRVGTSGSSLRLPLCWGVGWRWRDRRTPKGCVCCGTIGVTSSALHGPVICPLCVPPRPCEMLSSRKPAHQNRQAQRCTHSPTAQHYPPPQPLLTHAHLNICTYEHIEKLPGWLLQHKHKNVFYFAENELNCTSLNWNPLRCFLLFVGVFTLWQ